MKFFGFNINISREAAGRRDEDGAPVERKSMPISAREWLRGDDLNTGGASLTNAYEQVVWVYRAINALAEQVANVPFLFSVGERGRENLITSGPLPEFYRRPHPQLNRFQYWELRVMWLMLRGECMRIPIYEGGVTSSESLEYGDAEDGVPTNRERAHASVGTRSIASPNSSSGSSGRRLSRVLLLDPANFQHIVEDHRLIGWRYTGLDPRAPLASQVFLPEEVWFEKLPNPFDFWRGFPPLHAATAAAQTDFAAGAFMRGTMENNGDTGVIVRSEKRMSDEQQAQIVAALVERKRRAGTADRPLFLNGVTEIVRPQLSSSDLQFLENRKFSRAEICAALGVPEEIVTTTDHAKYDVMTGARLNFIEHRVAPLCSRLEAEEEPTVRALDPRASGWFDLDSLPILQEARRNRLAAARAGFEMGVPFNQLNRVLDLGFKPLPWGDRGYVAGKLTQVGEETTGRPGTASLPSAFGRDALPRVPIISGGGPDSPNAMTLPNAIVRAQDLLTQVVTREDAADATPFSSCLLSKLRRFLFEQRSRALAKLASLPRPSAAGAEASEGLLDLAAEDARLLACLQPVLVAELRAAAERAGGKLCPAQEAEYLKTRQPAFEALNHSTMRSVQELVAASQKSGEAKDQLTARLRALYNAATCRAEEFAKGEAQALEVARKNLGTRWNAPLSNAGAFQRVPSLSNNL